MNEKITEGDALRRFPELHELVTIRSSGWVFRGLYDESGELVGIVGSYSRRQYTDALFIFDRHNVSAARVLDDSYGGGCVWAKEGTDLQEVVRDLLGLPEPGESGAPSLVKRSSLLWTPA
ncbi:hypothetical protein [Actinokineospora xionganensis]|uniref:Uncharacterized protein n=1 Tax=Actinokineospora xionganensis TaxID=2684470 RepID=A0ABR7L3U9_9PSEU|nr:hypothetical protein [Actinokineospora xionganensis]MBC6447356.1 hypothetical protein [Actinokineospora xionganensis]